MIVFECDFCKKSRIEYKEVLKSACMNAFCLKKDWHMLMWSEGRYYLQRAFICPSCYSGSVFEQTSLVNSEEKDNTWGKD